MTKDVKTDELRSAEKDLARSRQELGKAVERDVQARNSNHPSPEVMDSRGPTTIMSPRDRMLLGPDDGDNEEVIDEKNIDKSQTGGAEEGESQDGGSAD